MKKSEILFILSMFYAGVAYLSEIISIFMNRQHAHDFAILNTLLFIGFFLCAALWAIIEEYLEKQKSNDHE